MIRATAILTSGILLALSTASLAQDTTALDHGHLHQQPWIHASDGDLRADLGKAAAEGKTLMVLWEQEGCYYCGKLHKDNFTRPEIVKLLNRDYVVVQLDLRGDGEVTALDGTPMTEAQLARKWRVNTTPTTVALSSSDPGVTSYQQAEVFRLPGYLKPFEHYAVIDYVGSGAWEDQTLSDYMVAMTEEFASRGIDTEKW